jgi:hypothetical protein
MNFLCFIFIQLWSPGRIVLSVTSLDELKLATSLLVLCGIWTWHCTCRINVSCIFKSPVLGKQPREFETVSNCQASFSHEQMLKACWIENLVCIS